MPGAFGMAMVAPLQMAHAQAFPAKPIRFVVPFPAGGGVDLVA
ncbi:MAG: ABC transporter substrate-binding protein, partial [Betaproteobacteria bacterium]|nr:ABC transporter substrate-binding protein [Betaproteobacteria bacterium]